MRIGKQSVFFHIRLLVGEVSSRALTAVRRISGRIAYVSQSRIAQACGESLGFNNKKKQP